MSTPETASAEVAVEPQAFVGPHEFARRCIEAATFTQRLMNHAAKDISNPSVYALHRHNFRYLRCGIELDDPEIDAVLQSYAVRFVSTAETYQSQPDDTAFFEAIFSMTPDEDVFAHRLAGGVIFSCEGPDYIRGVKNVSSNKNRADRLARRSIGIAFGKLAVGQTGKEVPVGAVKHLSGTSSRWYPHNGAPTTPLLIDQVGDLELYFSEGDEQHRVRLATVAPRKLEAFGLVIERFRSDIVDSRAKYSLGDVTKGLETDFGPFRIRIIEGYLTISIIPESDAVPIDSFITLKSGAAHAALTTHSTKIHELQHLLNELYQPARKKELGSVDNQEEFIKAAAAILFKGPLDEAIWNEFLAQMAGGQRIMSIVDILATEVEKRGLCYDFVADNLLRIRQMAVYGRQVLIDYEKAADEIENAVRQNYRSYLEYVGDEIIEHGLQSIFEPLSNQELVALLAPHPFYRWPIVIRAYDRYRRHLQTGLQTNVTDLIK